MANLFMDNWIIPYGIPTFLLTYNGLQFVSQFFRTLCSLLGTKHVTTTSYQPQRNGQTERYNKTISYRLRHYLAENKRYFDHYLQLLTYAYNAQIHRSTNMAPVRLMLSRKPPRPNKVTTMNFPLDITKAPPMEHLATRFMARMTTMRATEKAKIIKKQLRYKADYDEDLMPLKEFHVVQCVFFDRTPNTTQTPAKKLAFDAHSKLLPKSTGPFIVKNLGSHTLTVEENGVENNITADRETL